MSHKYLYYSTYQSTLQLYANTNISKKKLLHLYILNTNVNLKIIGIILL